MNSVDFENDISIIIKTHSLPLKRSRKEIKLILIFHITYEIIEIKIYENTSNKLLGREILKYDDIFQIFNNYFICFNENMQRIYSFISNCINLKKCEIYLNEATRTINLEVFILKDNSFDSKNIYITSIYDENKWNLMSQKIKELNRLVNKQVKNIRVAPFLNCIKYENNLYSLYFDIYVEKEIEILVFKVTLIYKNNNIIIFNNSYNKEKIYSAFYSREDINNITKSYYEPISNINEISDDLKLSIFNKNIKVDFINDDKIKFSITVISSINQYKIYFELNKGIDIKNKYIQIIKELKLKNEILANNDIIQSRNTFLFEQKNKNINIIKNNNINNKINFFNSIKNQNNANDTKENEKKIIGKKRKRLRPAPKNKKNKEKESKQNKEDVNDEETSSVSNENLKGKKIVKNAIENALNTMLDNMEDSIIKKSKKNGDKKRIKFIAPQNLKKILSQKKKKDEPYVLLNGSIEVERKK